MSFRSEIVNVSSAEGINLRQSQELTRSPQKPGAVFVLFASHWNGVAIKGTITCTCKLAEAETN